MTQDTVMLIVVMLNVVMLNVVMLNVMVPGYLELIVKKKKVMILAPGTNVIVSNQ
jgi:hypothetical protein